MARSVGDGTPRQRRAQVDLSLVRTAEELVTAYGIANPTGWDALVIGDGSGTTNERACGWGAVLLERTEPDQKVFSGSLSNGTNNMAELLAILQPLMDLTARKRGSKSGGLLVHVFSDSSYVVDGLNKPTSVLLASTAAANRELWLALHGARRNGLVIVAHHVPRDTLSFQQLCHDTANACRISQQNYSHNPQQYLSTSGV